MSALTKISFKLLDFLKAKMGACGSLKILHSSGCCCMVVQCSRTMVDKLLRSGWYVVTNDTLLFVLFSLYWMRSFLSIPLALLKQCLIPLFFRWKFQFPPRRFFGSLFIGADAFDSGSLAEWKILVQCLGWQLCGDGYSYFCWSPPVVLRHTVCSVNPKCIFHSIN